jgi:hypothetical protein
LLDALGLVKSFYALLKIAKKTRIIIEERDRMWTFMFEMNIQTSP